MGVEGLSKPLNAGNLFRSAHAFGAGFLFTIGGIYSKSRHHSDTSQAPANVPLYEWTAVGDLQLPAGCKLVGVELTEDAVLLPQFRHPTRAAYVLGPERGSLSPELLARCDVTVKIPTSFCINVAMAGAIVMYDRLLTLGRFGERPVSSLTAPEPPKQHVHGPQKFRTAVKTPSS